MNYEAMNPDRIIREQERKLITGLSAASWWRGERDSKLPCRIRLSDNAVGWRLSEIMQWVESRQVVTPETAKQVAPGCKTRGRKPKKQEVRA